ncbi:hypothetical protein BG58_17760 [Caballeronia jiangsuensis]|nr:hypothetical protein BG58_17760 [Caballeronia jiangsuensis]
MLKEATGKVQEAVGSGVADAMTQTKGKAGQLAGATQEFAGSMAAMVRDKTEENPLVVLGIVAVSSFLLGVLIGRVGPSRNFLQYATSSATS